MAIKDTVKGHCPTCNDNRIADIVAFHKETWEDEEHPLWTVSEYRILKCRGCESIYFQREEIFSEDVDHKRNAKTGEFEEFYTPDITYWPAPSKRSKPVWYDEISKVDQDLYFLLEEVYNSLNNDIRVMAAIGIRTVFDKSSEFLGVKPENNFGEKLTELEKLNLIGKVERENLSILTDAGSAAAHRGWKPTLDQLKTMMEIIEGFLYRTFILDDKAKLLKTKIPVKKKKVKPQ